MEENLKGFQKAVRMAIAENHAKGLPVYQCKEGYIVAIYPGGREVRLQKATSPSRVFQWVDPAKS